MEAPASCDHSMSAPSLARFGALPVNRPQPCAVMTPSRMPRGHSPFVGGAPRWDQAFALHLPPSFHGRPAAASIVDDTTELDEAAVIGNTRRPWERACEAAVCGIKPGLYMHARDTCMYAAASNSPSAETCPRACAWRIRLCIPVAGCGRSSREADVCLTSLFRLPSSSYRSKCSLSGRDRT